MKQKKTFFVFPGSTVDLMCSAVHHQYLGGGQQNLGGGHLDP